MIWSNKEKTQGQWLNNLLTGPAIFTDTKGVRNEEKWKNGTRDPGRTLLKRKEEDISALLQNSEAPTWRPDNEFDACFKCEVAFSLVNRRHHCRHCGFVFCNNCTQKRIAIARFKSENIERVCDECFIAVKTQEIINYFDTDFRKDFPQNMKQADAPAA